MTDNIIRRIIQKIGFDFHRYHYPPDKLSCLKDLEIKTVLDIGANIGQFATEIRKRLPEATIISFEPLKECFEKLNENFCKDKKFKSFNCALGSKEGETHMHQSAYTPSSSILNMSDNHKMLFPHTKESQLTRIKIKKLDDLAKDLNLLDNILIKMDVQGFEDQVMAGGNETFRRSKAAIIESSFIELYRGQPLFGDIYEKMKLLGFSYCGSIEEKADRKSGRIISEDSLFIKSA